MPRLNSQKARSFSSVLKSFVFGALLTATLFLPPPPKAQSLASVPACPEWNIGGVFARLRHGDTADPTPAGQIAKQAIESGFPTVIYSADLSAETPTLIMRIWNDGGSGNKVSMYPSNVGGTEYMFYTSGSSGFMVGGNLQINTSTGAAKVSWDQEEDDTANYGSVFNVSDASWTSAGAGDGNFMVNGALDTCIYAIGGRISSPAGVDIPYLTLSEIDNQVPPVDHGWNVGDWLKEIWGFIANIPELVASLFLPDSTTVSTIATDFTDFFEEKLGFLFWPFDFIGDVFNLFMGTGINDEFDDFGNPYNLCYTYTPLTTNATYWSFGNFFGEGVWINPCMFEYAMPTIWTFATLAARALLVYSVVNFLLSAYRRNVK